MCVECCNTGVTPEQSWEKRTSQLLLHAYNENTLLISFCHFTVLWHYSFFSISAVFLLCVAIYNLYTTKRAQCRPYWMLSTACFQVLVSSISLLSFSIILLVYLCCLLLGSARATFTNSRYNHGFEIWGFLSTFFLWLKESKIIQYGTHSKRIQ